MKLYVRCGNLKFVGSCNSVEEILARAIRSEFDKNPGQPVKFSHEIIVSEVGFHGLEASPEEKIYYKDDVTLNTHLVMLGLGIGKSYNPNNQENQNNCDFCDNDNCDNQED